MPRVSISSIQAAHDRIRSLIHRTPVFTSRYFDKCTAAQLFFKCENLQKAGAFKSRGACNAVFSLRDSDAAKGVLTHSSGNHGQALARAATLRGIPAFIVMPTDAAAPKQSAVRDYGGSIIHCLPTLASREETARKLLEETGAILIHPYDNPDVISGQGTAAVELIEDVSQLDAVITPVGGGGLLGGTALAAAALSPDTQVFGAEPANADDAFRSLRVGHIVPSIQPRTIADGLRSSLGSLTFPILQEHVAAILRTEEESIIQAMRLMWERMKMIIEPSAAVAVACVLGNPEVFSGKRVGVILSGGNLDLDAIPW